MHRSGILPGAAGSLYLDPAPCSVTEDLPGPLDGVRVIEFAQLAPGPYAGLVLAELGAEVVKVEPPVGDPVRSVPPMIETTAGGASALFCALNRGKKSVELDLKQDDDVERYKALAATAGIVLDGYRAGVADRLGVGFETLAEDREDLVYVGLSGFGPEGELAQEPGHDVTYQAWMGALDPDTPRLPELPVADFTGALWAALLAVAHLNQGGTHRLEASLAGALKAPLFLDHALGAAGAQTNPIRDGLPGYNVYPCSDGGLLALGALEPPFWRSLCMVVGDPALFELGHPAGPEDEAYQRLAELLADDPVDTWVKRFRDGGVPAAPVRSIQEAMADPAGTTSVDPPSVEGPRDLEGAPELGEHTDEILDPLG